MLRLPAVAGRFYPSNPQELTSLIREYSRPDPEREAISVKACLVPHAGYRYSGHVAGAVYARVAWPRKIIVLGVRHYPRGEPAAILSDGAWRTPLGDAPIDEGLAAELRGECPLLREDSVAHSTEHSLEVQLPFLQVLAPGFWFRSEEHTSELQSHSDLVCRLLLEKKKKKNKKNKQNQKEDKKKKKQKKERRQNNNNRTIK